MRKSLWFWCMLVLGLFIALPTAGSAMTLNVTNGGFVGFGIYGSQQGTIIIDNVKLEYLGS